MNHLSHFISLNFIIYWIFKKHLDNAVCLGKPLNTVPSSRHVKGNVYAVIILVISYQTNWIDIILGFPFFQNRNPIFKLEWSGNFFRKQEFWENSAVNTRTICLWKYRTGLLQSIEYGVQHTLKVLHFCK